MKKIILLAIISLSCCFAFGQNNIGTPYSYYGLGLLPENTGAYAAMGGVSAAMRDNDNINYLNPASYTALDSNRFYFQLAMNGEYTWITTHREASSYRVMQHSYLNMALRLWKDLYFSFGFTEKSDIGYNINYNELVSGSTDYTTFNQALQGMGGLNDIYGGLGWRYKNLSLGINFSYIFGKIEKQQTLIANMASSYYVRTSERINVHDMIFQPGIQYNWKLNSRSNLILGATMNFSQKLWAKQKFKAYKVNTGSVSSTMLDDETLKRGYIVYPFRISGGFNFQHKNRLRIAGDYTFHQLSEYEAFKAKQNLKDYHKAAFGVSLTPDAAGRFFRQRINYMAGAYFVDSGIRIRGLHADTYGLTAGVQMPFILPNIGNELLLGVALDAGMRGSERDGLVMERYIKLRVNIAFKEFWFMKRKIN